MLRGMNELDRLPWYAASLCVWYALWSAFIALNEFAQGAGMEDSVAVGGLFSLAPAIVCSCLFFQVLEKSVRRVLSSGQPGSERPIPIGEILDLLLTELLDRAVAMVLRPEPPRERHE